MKKLIIAVILIGSASFAGCGGAGDVSADRNAADSVQAPQGSDPEASLAAEPARSFPAESAGEIEAVSPLHKKASDPDENADCASVNDPEAVDILSAPAGLAVEDYGSTALTLRWHAVANAEGYNIYRSSGLSGCYTKMNSKPVDGAVFTDECLSENTLYRYKVSAVNASAESALSAAVSQRTANSAMAYVRFCNLGSVSIAGMRLGRSWFRPVKVGETTSYVEALPGTYFFEYWNADTLEWETVSTGMFTLQAGRRYTVRDADAAAYLVTDDVLRQEDATVFIESMSSSKNPASKPQISE